jgi:hypothetical protein
MVTMVNILVFLSLITKILTLFWDVSIISSVVNEFMPLRSFYPAVGRALKLRNNNKAGFEALTGEYEECSLLAYDSV